MMQNRIHLVLSLFILWFSALILCTSCQSKYKFQKIEDAEETGEEAEPAGFEELIQLFEKWDSAEITNEEKETIANQYEGFLTNNPNMTNEEIKELSDNFDIMEEGEFRIITFVEEESIYGKREKESYVWASYKDKVCNIFFKDYKLVKYLIQDLDDPDIYYIVGTDYATTTRSGFYFSGIVFQANDLYSYLDILEITDQNSFYKEHGVLYADSTIHIQYISEGARKIVVATSKKQLVLTLSEDKCLIVEE